MPMELGVLFRPTVDGAIIGLRFYKVPGDTGPHVGSLWTPKGKRLATVTFVNETDTGWQEALFSTPVPVSAMRLLVASYFAPVAGQMFATAPPPESVMVATPDPPVFQRPPIKDESTSVYRLDEPGFPSSDDGAGAVWVDVVFVPTPTIP